MSSNCNFLNGPVLSAENNDDSSPGSRSGERVTDPQNGEEHTVTHPPERLPGEESSLFSTESTGPFVERSQMEGDGSNFEEGKVGDLGDDDMLIGVGSFDLAEDDTNIDDAAWTANQFREEDTQDPNETNHANGITDETEQLQFGQPPPGMMLQPDNERERSEGSIGSQEGNKKRKASKKRTGSGKGRDQKASSVAKKTKLTSFKNYFDHWLLTQPQGIPAEWPKADESFMTYAKQTVECDKDMDEYTKNKLMHVLNEKSQGKSFAEIWSMTVKSFGKVPRGIDYAKKECRVCRVAVDRIIDLNDHNCPYRHYCFDESWKQPCVLREDCVKHHGQAEV